MEIRNSTYTKIAKIINGDTGIAPYMSGPSLIDFFSNFGFDDNYGNGFPSRWIYAEARVKEIFELKKYNDFFTAILDEYRFADTDFNSEIVLEEINKHLSFDNYKVIKNGKKFVLNSLDGHIVNITEEHLEILSTEFLLEQINKCEDKIRNEDYDGAITNSRSLVEEVLLALEEEITGNRGQNTGDMDRLYKRVKQHTGLDPSQPGLNTQLLQILTGLNSIVIGVSSLRTKVGDAHAREYKPERHHAELAVNTAKTFTAFVISSHNYRKTKGIV